MGNFLHKLFGYADDESSCFRRKGNQVQPETMQDKPPKQNDIEKGIPANGANHSTTATPSFRSAMSNVEEYSSDDELEHSTIFPKVSVKRSLQSNLTPTASVKANSKNDDYNNNNGDCVDNNPSMIVNNPAPRLCVDVSRPFPVHLLPKSQVPEVQLNSSQDIPDTSSFHSIELSSVHSVVSYTAQNDSQFDNNTYNPHSRPSYDDSVHVTFEPESLTNIDLDQKFESPFKRDFALPQHAMLEVVEKSRPRRSNVRRSTRIRPTRYASDSRKNSDKPVVTKRVKNDGFDYSEDSEEEEERPQEPEVNIDDMPAEARRNAVKSRLSDLMLKRTSQMMNGEVSPNRYRNFDVTIRAPESLPTHDEEDTLTASTNGHVHDEHSASTNMNSSPTTNVQIREDKIQELLNSNTNHDDDDHENEMEPIPEHDNVQLRAKPFSPLGVQGHSMLMEELKKRQSARQSVYDS